MGRNAHVPGLCMQRNMAAEIRSAARTTLIWNYLQEKTDLDKTCTVNLDNKRQQDPNLKYNNTAGASSRIINVN
jgi:hypothetical protein